MSEFGRARRRRGFMARGRRRRYGQALHIYSGFGKLPPFVAASLPPIVAGGLTLGGTLLMRAFIDPVKMEMVAGATTKTPKLENGKLVSNAAFKYAPLISAGIGLVGAGVTGALMGWSAFAAGAATALTTGLTAQFVNSVVSDENLAYLATIQDGKRFGMVAFQQRPKFQGLQGRGAMKAFSRSGMGAIAATPFDRYLKPGRRGMPAEVMAAVNQGAFGPSVPGMGM